MVYERVTSDRAFLGVTALVFAASATVTIAWAAAMPAMPICSSRLMSMAWMPMPGMPMPGISMMVGAWPGAAALFLGMWLVMMAAMMLPSLTPMLWRYRQAVSKSTQTRIGGLTALVGLGYFSVWALVGLAVFPLGAVLMTAEMQFPTLAQAMPMAAGVMVMIAGIVQLSAWKARQLACCRTAPGHGRALSATAGTAWRQGWRLGWKCVACCGNLTAILLVIGMMDLRAMIVVTAAISAERLLPSGARIARALGVIIIGAGFLTMATHLSK